MPTKPALIAAALGVIVAGSGCGPELTEPGDIDISGRWFASGPAAGLTNVTVNFLQAATGDLQGSYTATGTPGYQLCAATGPCNISGTLEGSNTTLQVYFELQNAGKFTGQVIEETNLRGAMSQADQIQPIQFERLLSAAP